MMFNLSKSFAAFRFFGIFLLGTLMIPFPIHTLMAKPQQTLSARSIESRSFQMTTQPKMIEAIVTTLQDMGYIIIRTDKMIGFVTATRFSDDIIELTVTTQPQHNSIIVRASARVNDLSLTDDPTFYQNFFNHLSQALFLNANKIY